MEERTGQPATTNEIQPEEGGQEPGPAGTWGGGTDAGAQATGAGTPGEEGGEGGYGGGSSGFDEPPEQGLGGETTTGWGDDSDLGDPAFRDPAGLKGSEGSATGETGETGMSDKEIEEQPRGA